MVFTAIFFIVYSCVLSNQNGSSKQSKAKTPVYCLPEIHAKKDVRCVMQCGGAGQRTAGE